MISKKKKKLKSNIQSVSFERPPFPQFVEIFEEVTRLGLAEPNAMVLSTLSEDGKSPHSRVVLMKDHSDERITFFTNYNSTKAKQIVAHPQVSLLFFWQPLAWQIRIVGRAEKSARESSEAYFNSRSREKQLGAWSSPQSEVISSYDDLQSRYHELEKKFQDQTIPCPEHWGGFDIYPESFEFWFGQDARLHKRYCFRKKSNGEGWDAFMKAP